ncbi:tRNA (adenosine(37)-N6)-dimethylallyltransferase MiaA [Fuerstiella marisgermanici]|uniref:tRNA dimethylallyltransferase n=1 Tax=Fuerstiella marisgermanici TaxID=1891926 RepID=A0A1P8WKX9_9PLAN|nr:tRNA (adenosine(37)-N6)-dimethylallyltransferase MiaA [Fuerstiella marisgermanici]APZ94705.1 tRNA dimethylallyltransferase [Fuerstiella marisgermanici]
MTEELDYLKHCWFLAGPTAGGKTATAIELAKILNAEIVSMDSMAIYRGMDIGTAKPSRDEQNAVPHHLIDVVKPHQEFSVSEYVLQASEVARQILKRDRIPLFVGGTGLYLRSLLRGVFEGPPADWELRNELQRGAEERGNDWLHSELQNVDPGTAAKLHPNDVRRVVRAIEVFRLTGQPLSQQQQQTPLPPQKRPAAVFWIDPPRDWLHERINRRVDLMMQQGLLKETQQLLAAEPPPGRTARQALGYREIISHLEDGVPLDDAVEQIKTGTRQFAKRQHTWFRNLEECSSVSITGSENPQELAVRLKAITATRPADETHA